MWVTYKLEKGSLVNHYWEAGIDLETNVKLIAMRSKLNFQIQGGQGLEFTTSEGISLTVGGMSVNNPCFTGDQVGKVFYGTMRYTCKNAGHPDHVVFEVTSPMAAVTEWENWDPYDPACCE